MMDPIFLHWLQWFGTIVTGVITGLLTTGISALFKLFWKAVHAPRSPVQKAAQLFQDATSTWRPGFVLLLCVLLVDLLGSSIYTFTLSNGSLSFVAFCLSFILLLLTLIVGVSGGIRDHVPRNLLLMTGGSALVSCIILQTNSTVQDETTKVLHGLPPGQLLVFGVLIIALVSLIRAMLRWDNWFEWTERVTVFGFVVICMLLQSALGENERIPFLSINTFPLATPMTRFFSLNYVVVLVLLLVAILTLCTVTRNPSTLERFLLFVCTIAFSWQQLSFGEEEVQQWLPQADKQLIVSVNQGIALGLIVLGFCLLAQYKRPWIRSLLLLGITFPSVLLQNVLSKQTTILFLSVQGQQLSGTIYQLIVWGVCIAALVLFARLGRNVHWIDRVIIFIIASVSALLQYSFGESEGMHMQLSAYNFEQSPFSLLEVIGFNHVLVFGLVLAAIVMLIRWTHDEFTGTDHIVLIGLPISAAILQILFGGNEQLPGLHLDAVSNSLPCNLLITGVLGLSILFALVRIKRPFNGWDRVMLIICAGSCVLLLWNNTDAQQFPQLSTTIQQLEENVLHLATLNGLVVAILSIVDATLSFIWLRRPFTQQDCKILQIVFGVSLVAAVFQLFLPFLLLVVLFTLLLGVTIATQMERTYNISTANNVVRSWQSS